MYKISQGQVLAPPYYLIHTYKNASFKAALE